MSVKKYKSFEAAERDLWTFHPDDRYYQRLRAFYIFATRFHFPRSPRVVLKFRTIGEANESTGPSSERQHDR